MDSKFLKFLAENKIDARRLSAVSRRLERLRREDRELKRQRSNAKSEAAANPGSTEKKETAKPRSGRGASRVLLKRASTGKVTGPNKQRLLRAVNHILTQRQQDPVDIRALF